MILLLALVGLTQAHEVLKQIEVSESSESARPLSHLERDQVQTREVLRKEDLRQKNAHSLASALDRESGVQTTITCGTCGSQRITLNGLRGENTTVLIDGLPAFSSLSSFYGMEAIPITGLEKIEINRGAGQSLAAPEAIGGSVNMLTLTPDHNSLSVETRGGENGLLQSQVVGSWGDYRKGLLLAAQTRTIDGFDRDHNNVAEISAQNQRAIFTKGFYRQDKWTANLRAGHQDLELIGGSLSKFRGSAVPTSVDPLGGDFANNDIRNRYTGSAASITDWIRLKRTDLGASVITHVNQDLSVKASLALSTQEQLSLYSHGYDYDFDNNYRFVDLKANLAASESHLLTFGVDHRSEDMSSRSRQLYGVKNLIPDDFRFNTFGAYVQDEWSLNANQQLTLVLRADQQNLNRKDSRINDLNTFTLAPRVHYKHEHSPTLNSRASYGLGYRTPLSLFESQHGTNEEGFESRLRTVEKAHSVTYSLEALQKKSSQTLTVNATYLEDMAYGDESQGEKMVFINAQDDYLLTTFSFTHQHQVNSHWTLEGSFDYFSLPSGYTRKLPIAAVESRARLMSDVHWGKWEVVSFLNLTGPRNLDRYNYNKHYNRVEDDLGTEVPVERKGQRAPFFFTLDLNVQRKLSGTWSALLGVTNLFDTTQTKMRESPLTWRVHGADHVHLDNRHIWGPLQGRVIYAGLRAEFI